MFIDNKQTQPSENSQRGQYLQLVSSTDNDPDDYSKYRAIVRTVTVVPFGNFSAVSHISIGARGHRPIYGDTVVVHPDVFELCTPIPEALAVSAAHYRYSETARNDLRAWARRNVNLLSAPIVSSKGKRQRQERDAATSVPVKEPSLPTTCKVCDTLTWVMANYCDNCGADLIAQFNDASTTLA